LRRLKEDENPIALAFFSVIALVKEKNKKTSLDKE